jgi:hypothetical protein
MRHRSCDQWTALMILCERLQVFWDVTVSHRGHSPDILSNCNAFIFRARQSRRSVKKHPKTSTFDNAAVHSMSEACNPLLPWNKNILDQNKHVACHLKSHTGSNLKSMLATNCGSTFSSNFSAQPSTFLHKQTVQIINFFFLSNAAVWPPSESWNEQRKTLSEGPQHHDHAETRVYFFPGFFRFWNSTPWNNSN